MKKVLHTLVSLLSLWHKLLMTKQNATQLIVVQNFVKYGNKFPIIEQKVMTNVSQRNSFVVEEVGVETLFQFVALVSTICRYNSLASSSTMCCPTFDDKCCNKWKYDDDSKVLQDFV